MRRNTSRVSSQVDHSISAVWLTLSLTRFVCQVTLLIQLIQKCDATLLHKSTSNCSLAAVAVLERKLSTNVDELISAGPIITGMFQICNFFLLWNRLTAIIMNGLKPAFDGLNVSTVIIRRSHGHDSCDRYQSKLSDLTSHKVSRVKSYRTGQDGAEI
ncbi:unnamed protein product [Soboliphyme baturini]|uniref:Secreted protein n=1 Tax=Soboliphyme baturini TaxID=241478 RepID=A0A183ICJ5_9BILA|nr:unnamed protein product [Soboliphyme baturini]